MAATGPRHIGSPPCLFDPNSVLSFKVRNDGVQFSFHGYKLDFYFINLVFINCSFCFIDRNFYVMHMLQQMQNFGTQHRYLFIHNGVF